VTLRAPWWSRDEHARRRPFLLDRERIVAAIRRWFAARSFLEVDAVALQVSPGNEAHLHAFATEAVTTAGERQPLYLHTSPEFAMKKLLAAGEERIFSLGHVFRNRERGALHHPEFTMLEWYRAREEYDTVMQDSADFVRLAAETTGRPVATFRNRSCDLTLRPERVSVADAFRELAGIDLLATAGPGRTDCDGLAAACRAAGIRIAEDDTWSDMFSRVLVEKVEPASARAGRPCSIAIQSRRPRLPGRRETIRVWPNGSNSMPAAWNSRTASGS
jgi:lysyl-tRNA synthetase class 2